MFDGKPVDRVKTHVSYVDSVLSFNQIEAKSGNGIAEAPELRLDFTPKKGLHIATKVKAEQIDIDNLFRLFRINPYPYGSPTGRLSGHVALDYYSETDRFDVDFDLRHNLLTLYGERFGTDVLRGSWNDGDLMVTEFGLKKGTGTISITGAMLGDRTISFIGIMSDIESKSINNRDFRKLKVHTSMQAFVILEGNLDHPNGSADIRIGNTVARGVHYGPTNLQLELDGDTLSGRGDIAENTALVEHFNVNLNSKRFEFEGAVNNFDLLGLVDVGTRSTKASLQVAGDLALKGRFTREPDLSGQINLSKVQITMDEFAFKNLQPLSIRADKSRFGIKSTRFKGPNVVFNLKGVAGLDNLNLKVVGAANLVAVKSLVDVFEKSDGIVNFEISARGPLTAPSLSGNAVIKDSSVRIKKFPYHIEHLNGQIFLTPKAIRFTDFSAKVADGTVDVNGEVLLEEDTIAIASYLFKLHAEDVKLALIDDLAFTASTIKNDLTLKSPRNDELPKITGDIEIRDLRYTQDIRVLEMSDLSMDRLSGARVRTRKPKLIDKKNDIFAFDVQLHGKKNLEARNNLFDMDLAIDDVDRPLRLVGTNQTLGFLGRVLGKRGQVRFGGKRFDVKYADVDFQDPDRPDNPNFRVTADGQIRDWKVTITAEGTIEEYELKLSSQPYLPKEDVIFVILTGMTKAENRQFGAATLTPLLSQLGPGGKSIPVEFKIYNAYSEQAGTETTRIALGRWITPDIWVSVSSSLGQERDVEAELDYKINDQFSVSSDYEDDSESSVGNMGLDLKFRLEF
jgi:autotransporter translocation and assembly factor TamB